MHPRTYYTTLKEHISAFWAYLWYLHAQTKAYLRFDAPAILDDLSIVSKEERKVAERVFADGGRDKDPAEIASNMDNNSAGSPGGSPDGSGGSSSGDDDEDEKRAEVQDDETSSFDVGGEYDTRQKVGFVLGPALFLLIFLFPSPEGLAYEAQTTAAITAWVAAWWMSEAIPIPATSILPIVLFPVTGALPVAETTPSYAHPLIFLFMGGFFLAMAMQRWGLHRRIALRIIKAVGTTPSRLILGFMLATAFLSMWISNTATVMMMVPIALAVIYQTADLVKQTDMSIPTGTGEFRFGVALMLCIAYGASVGGVATLIGTPPNIIFAGQAGELFGETISFYEWMLYGVPIAAVGIVMVYVYVSRLAMKPQFESLPVGIDTIDRQLKELGDMSRQELMVLIVFAGMAVSWIGVSLIDEASFVLLGIDFDAIPIPDDADTIVAIGGAMVLFTIPTKTSDGGHTFLLNWTHAVKIPWGVILLFGGGLAIANAFGETGLAVWIGDQLSVLEGTGMLIIILVVVTMTVFLTEVTSNTATTAMLMPILAGVAIGISVHPYGLMIGAATAASFAFMLPVATPPNAIVFGSGYITIPQMAKVGIGLNILGIILVLAIVLTWLPVAWGIELAELPATFEEAFGND
ncbi:SLC13 family permease [Salinarchaeum sp. IM2453]|uniref:SLC13 family permease n=1 Tax=Salinarchaeum sp. IM2453 TaxID=2862870 RepID=UPI001C82E7FE|nr:SLC13 family permease [Salinarchaeum sp. IM2453]QZA89000.1 SLC13 family permease [Salinarchaeum sp. IM2453]